MTHISNLLPTLTKKVSSRQEERKTFSKISQQCFKDKPDSVPYTPYEVRYPIPVDDVLRDPEYYIRVYLSDKERKALNVILLWNRLYPGKAVPSQSKLAGIVGVCRQTMNSILRKLHNLKLIFVGYRGVKRTCFYNVSPFFMKPDIRSALKHLLPDLQNLVITALLSVFAGTQVFAYNPQYRSSTTPSLLRINKKNIYISTKVTLSRIPMPRYMKELGNMEQLSRQEYGENPISPVIRRLTPLVGLTKWGQIKLSAFPDAAIEHVIDRLQYKESKDIRTLFAWIYVTAYRWCEENKIKPDYAFMRKLEDIFCVPENAEMLNKKYVVFVEPTETKVSQAPYIIWEADEESAATQPQFCKVKKKDVEQLKTSSRYPLWKSPILKKEDPDQAKKNIMTWLESQEAKNFAKLIGPEAFEKFVANRLAPLTEKEDDERQLQICH